MRPHVSILWLFTAATALAAGVAVYVADRPAATAYLLPQALTLTDNPGALFGTLGAFLPSFVHVYAFTLLTATVVSSSTPWSAAAIATAWCITDSLFELGQHPVIAPLIAQSLPAWFNDVPLLENVGPYFLRGTFDPADLIATLAGAAVAYLTINRSSKQGGVP
jgi:hypothetical protein